MTLPQLLAALPQPLDTLRGQWLVMPAAQRDALLAAQSPGDNLRVSPIALTDGRFAVCADLLSEIHPGGLFATQFASLDPSNFTAVEVIESIADLLPPPPVESP